ncbi:hypothetical protein PCANC_00263 [Puccinia coronata f. sp. avenae]|uniref:Hydrophobin n=1 Tax=Puccinia coronata f. sp. avenae TaxID=200324 RepID=A0A2N5W8Y5_9BASI|nr:hypothetical protein PCANC_00263 [Puccinia coronata f. sp. avenae]
MNFLQTILFLASATACAQGAQQPVAPCTENYIPIPWCISEYRDEQGVLSGYRLERKDPNETCKQLSLESTICCIPNFKPDPSSFTKVKEQLDRSCGGAIKDPTDPGSGGGQQPGNGGGGQSHGGGQHRGGGRGGQHRGSGGGHGQQGSE